MVPVNGKPVIGWILDNLISKGIQSVVVVLRKDDNHLEKFLRWGYMERMDLTLHPISPGGSIVDSLRMGINTIPDGGSIRVILGDTLIRDSFENGFDFVYVGNVQDSKRWCLVELSPDDHIVKYIDKQEYPFPEKIALAGYYQFVDGSFLKECVQESHAANENQLSFVLSRYGEKYPIKAQKALEWFDFGNIDNLVNARRELLQTRHFNSVKVNPILNTLTKISSKNEKLQDELDWYLELPSELQVLTPRIIEHHKAKGQLHIVQEYYGYPSLAEHYLYSSIDEEMWISILRKVISIHNEFRSYSGDIAEEQVFSVYYSKTVERLAMLSENDDYWNKLLEMNQIEFNGIQLEGIYSLLPAIEKKAKALAKSVKPSIIHGDLCFPNILFDVNNQIIRLIDPRGNFGGSGIYGDPRYDIAKLRHSIIGLYDFIMADMFSIREDAPGIFSGRLFSNDLQGKIAGHFDDIIEKEGYILKEIRLIEGLLFISMLPYHENHLQRQQMLYLAGLTLLNGEL